MHNLRYKLLSDERLILVDKPIGVTPYECVTKIKVEKYEAPSVDTLGALEYGGSGIPPEQKYSVTASQPRSSAKGDKNTKIGYAGRLDPMASGLLLLLVGDENKRKHYYEKLPKQYAVDVLLGVSTDSADLLGVLQSIEVPKTGFIFPKQILQKFLGSQTMTYPVFSSKRVQGKPLYNFAHKKTLDLINIPQKNIEIFNVEYVDEFAVTAHEILQRVDSEIPSIRGKFRQDEIVAKWHMSLDDCPKVVFTCLRIVVDCESGTYMRWLAEEIGKKANLPALAYNIRRLKVGDFGIEQLGKD